jgi:nucleoside-diphosphate-sugar epimerase
VSAPPKKRVLITGATGTVGGALREYLADRYELISLTRRPAAFPSRVVELDDLEGLISAFRGVDAIVHLAAAATVESPWDEVLAGNVVGAYNVFEAARRAGVELVVFASSNHVIGTLEVEAAPGLYELDDPRVFGVDGEARPDSLYGVSKVFGEALARYFVDHHRMRAISLRIGSVVADDDPRSERVAAGPSWMNLTREQALARMRATWLSRRDCAELVACCLEADDVRWACVFGISANARTVWDPTPAQDLLGYSPHDGTAG